jgi:hypothetical protein
MKPKTGAKTMLSRSEPYRDLNPFFKDGQPTGEYVLACYNNVILLDRRLIKSGGLVMTSKQYKWAVYDASNTNGFGEWLGFKTRKEAIEYFVRLATARPRFNVNDLITGTIAQAEFDRTQAACPNPTN